ncbi:hypothetical protein FFLO_06571 [Filobasidium floriforme]|uniref:Benzoate 4-monooxygenase n=1 Tax=Filobasidium floriforme TaxID=5210 RepID=A0A8K0JF44_9TREE|nr:cytochrome P450 monooxygenase pc-bph [Filobasidium floriforme]KAG7527828.1 hypothetical protein FFLO_06571 [Filobasidium floriforme]KAH8083994.1 cytochrome P450 monooxygenase pc-bph [Filobasidium floriforme]
MIESLKLSFPLVFGSAAMILLLTFSLSPERKLDKYPGPLLAKFSRLWLARQAGRGNRFQVVHELHKKYGSFVRLAPDHISISSPLAIPIVYGHGTGFTKADFYDAFVSIRRGLFNTRDRKEHTRKRKIVSHVFSQKNVLEFEEHIQDVIDNLFGKWDAMSRDKKLQTQGFDILDWLNFFAFDVIGSLAFGRPFGMVSAGRDVAPVSTPASTSGTASTGKVEHLPAIEILNRRGEYSATMGCIPPLLRPLAKKLPWFSRGLESVRKLAGIAIAAVGTRMELEESGGGADSRDLLSKLMKGKDENGNPMGREELTAEALTQLIAGSDTTSNSSCAILYYLSNNPRVVTKLLSELAPVAETKEPGFVSFSCEDVKDLPYLQACIDEALRLHSTSAIGLPRIVPEGGAVVCDEFFPEGMTLSVPAYTVHRDPVVWGEDADAYRPERWFEQDKAAMNASFIPFSFGPRSCVGRNLASMELLLIISSTVQRYSLTPVHPGQALDTAEGFLRKPTGYLVKMKRRESSIEDQ